MRGSFWHGDSTVKYASADHSSNGNSAGDATVNGAYAGNAPAGDSAVIRIDARAADRTAASDRSAKRADPDAADHVSCVHAWIRSDAHVRPGARSAHADVRDASGRSNSDICACTGAGRGTDSNDAYSSDIGAKRRCADLRLVPATAQGLPRPS